MKKIIFALLFSACTASTPSTVDVPNLHRLNANVWRSAQPETAEQWRELRAQMGADHPIVIKLNCETEGSDNLGRLEGFDVRQVCIEPRTDFIGLLDAAKGALRRPGAETMREIEAILTDECTVNKCLIHCVHGMDRTGLVSAMARVLLDGWSKDAAIKESQRIGMRPFPGLLRFWHDWEPSSEVSR